jgi:hypothetical protein
LPQPKSYPSDSAVRVWADTDGHPHCARCSVLLQPNDMAILLSPKLDMIYLALCPECSADLLVDNLASVIDGLVRARF